jgi:hypothetical protein
MEKKKIWTLDEITTHTQSCKIMEKGKNNKIQILPIWPFKGLGLRLCQYGH